MAEVIVFNKNSGLVRHIIDANKQSDIDAIKSWYYDHYHQLEGDEFHYCATPKERNKLVEILESGEEPER